MSETFDPSSTPVGDNPVVDDGRDNAAENYGQSSKRKLTTLKLPPHSVDAEQAVLGGLMLDNTEWDNIADVLLPEDFYRAEHQLIFQVMMQQSEASSPVDALTLVESLDSLNELEHAGGEHLTSYGAVHLLFLSKN